MKKVFERIEAHGIILMKTEQLRRVVDGIVGETLIEESCLPLAWISANVQHCTCIAVFIHDVLGYEIIYLFFFLSSTDYLVLFCAVDSQDFRVEFYCCL